MKRHSMSDAIVDMITAEPGRPQVVYRRSGSDYLLIEYGEMVLDLNLRIRVYLLEESIKQMKIDGVWELCPGVRSLLIHYDGLSLPLANLLDILKSLEKSLPKEDGVEIFSRLVSLPIACHDRWTKDAIRKYMDSTRSTAPYLPDNMEFVARANGLTGVEEVVRYLLSTEYLVIGLGDVYLGAPCAVPLDPRFRLVVPKYNPARTWTPEGTVGIGGAFMCIYPMESPGGYQLVGRTLPIWNTWQTNDAFKEAPWLLRAFDRVKFHLVTEEELSATRDDVMNNRYQFQISPGVFDIKEYNRFLASVQPETEAFRRRQSLAIDRATQGY